MLFGRRIAVVIPAYNEVSLIGKAIESVPDCVDHILVVDDASVDGTSDAACRVRDARVKVLRNEHNLGVGATIARGYSEAWDLQADIAVVMAGDAQMDGRELPRLVSPIALGRADYVKGDRLSHPTASHVMPRSRYIGNHLLSFFTRWAVGFRLRDSQCGYTALSRNLAHRIDLSGLWPRYGYPNDLLSRVLLAGARVEDVVVRPIYGAEKSGVRWRDAVVVIPWILMRAWFRRISTRRSPVRSLESVS